MPRTNATTTNRSQILDLQNHNISSPHTQKKAAHLRKTTIISRKLRRSQSLQQSIVVWTSKKHLPLCNLCLEGHICRSNEHVVKQQRYLHCSREHIFWHRLGLHFVHALNQKQARKIAPCVLARKGILQQSCRLLGIHIAGNTS